MHSYVNPDTGGEAMARFARAAGDEPFDTARDGRPVLEHPGPAVDHPG